VTRTGDLLVRRLSLRARMVLAALVAVTVVVTLGFGLVLLAVHTELVGAADDLGEVRAEQVAGLAREGVLPADLGESHDAEAAVQVVQGGSVISRTRGEGTGTPFPLAPQPPGEDDVVALERLPIDESGPFRVTALGTAMPGGPATVYVAVDVEDLEDTIATLARRGALGLAGTVLALSVVLWAVVGRTLAPVEGIRRRADEINGHHLRQRVPEPPQRDEIGLLARTINAMLSRLENSAWRQERFVADAAHELRSPLASMRTRLETARTRGAAGDETLVGDLLEETVRMSSLVDHLLILARNDAGRLRTGDHPVDLDEVVTDVLTGVAVPDAVRLDASAVQPVQVRGEAWLLEHAVFNLVENAVAHARSRVDLALRQDDGLAVLTVDDDGPGIPPERREDVFQRFVRLDSARSRRRGGVGLGLAIVADLVRTHGGEVEVGASPYGGARFVVRLPVSS
jgi:signal transduction histidine kinase